MLLTNSEIEVVPGGESGPCLNKEEEGEMGDEYNDLLGRAVKGTYGPSDLEQEAREVLDETGFTPRELQADNATLKKATQELAQTIGNLRDERRALKAENEWLVEAIKRALLAWPNHDVSTGILEAAISKGGTIGRADE